MKEITAYQSDDGKFVGTYEEVLKLIDEMIENLKFTPDEELSAQYKLCENGVITCLFRDVNEMEQKDLINKIQM